MDLNEAELITAISELLDVEPTGEVGECPWCGSIRAAWAGSIRSYHREECPWSRLRPAFSRWVADESDRALDGCTPT